MKQSWERQVTVENKVLRLAWDGSPLATITLYHNLQGDKGYDSHIELTVTQLHRLLQPLNWLEEQMKEKQNNNESN